MGTGKGRNGQSVVHKSRSGMRSFEPLPSPCSDGRMTYKKSEYRLLVLDDSLDWGKLVSDVASRCGFTTKSTHKHKKFFEAYRTTPVDVVVLDLFMPEKDGIEVIRDIAKQDHHPFIILMSGQSEFFLESAAKLGQAKGLDVIGTLSKPFRIDDLKGLLEKAMNLINQREAYRDEAESPCLPRPLQKKRQEGSADPADAKIVDLRKRQNATYLAETHKRVISDIAQINEQFCVMLWNAQLATLTTLKSALDQLAEAAAGVNASDHGSDMSAAWQRALAVNLRTLSDAREAIVEIADIHQQPAMGRSAVRSIDRIYSLVHPIAAINVTKESASAGKRASILDLLDDNDKLRDDLDTLAAAVTESLALALNVAGPNDQRRQSRSNKLGKAPPVSRLRKPRA